MTQHRHEYRKLGRPGWPGHNCRGCGFYLPPILESAARNQGAIFLDDSSPVEEIEQRPDSGLESE